MYVLFLWVFSLSLSLSLQAIYLHLFTPYLTTSVLFHYVQKVAVLQHLSSDDHKRHESWLHVPCQKVVIHPALVPK